MAPALQKVLKKYTKEQLARMVANLTDGQADYDLHAMTGMPMERCGQIARAGADIARALWG